jgi:zinc ribbon protein
MSPARKKPAASTQAASIEAAQATEAGLASEPSPAREAGAASEPGATTETCPWCSAKVSATAATCPSCGASLREAADGEILGVTQTDPAAVSRASRIKPGRLATWLGADSTDDTPVLGGHVEPPSKEVREEMLRLELAAIDAEIEAKRQAAEAQKLVPDDLVEGDAPDSKPS